MDAAFLASRVFGAFFQFTNFLGIHFVTASIGLLYVCSEMQREGTEDILNNMKESVIILQNQTGTIMFANAAAKRLNTHLKEELGATLYEDVENFSIY